MPLNPKTANSTQEPSADSVDQHQTAQNVHSDLIFTLSIMEVNVVFF